MTPSTVRRFVLCFAFLSVATGAAAQSGKAAYEKSCAACHGDTGQGRLAPALVPFTRGSQELLRIVRAGAGTMMNGFSAADVSDADVRAIEEYLRSLKPAAASTGSAAGGVASAPVVFRFCRTGFEPRMEYAKSLPSPTQTSRPLRRSTAPVW